VNAAGRGTRYVVASETRHKPDKPDIAGQTEATPHKKRPTNQRSVVKKAQVEAQVGAQVELSMWQVNILSACSQGEKTGKELLTVAGYQNRTGNFKKGLQRLVDDRLIEYTIPDKPNSRLQRYRLTAKGQARMAEKSDM